MTQKNSVHFISLGCPRNIVDSEVMIGLLMKHGYTMTPDVSKADAIVVNTCGFLDSARRESVDTIRSALSQKKPGAKLIVTGCLAQLNSPLLDELKNDIHYILGSGDVEGIISAVTAEAPGSRVSSAKSYLEQGDIPRTLSTPSHYAYLKISEGCRKGCSYCIIPQIKGPLRSKPEEQVLSEFSALLNRGVFEVILVAQDLGDYGKDFGCSGSDGLVKLLTKMLEIQKDFRIRLLYLYPDEITPNLIALMRSDERILPYLDMPIQHINDDILAAMCRKTSKKQIIETIDQLRKSLPSITLRTSLIVGFPGETEAQFEELLAFVKEYALENVGIFSYSKEDLSASATHPNQISDDIKAERCQRLAAIQKDSVRHRHERLIGKKLSVIIDGYHPETNLLLIGRHCGQCPEIDPVVLINDFRQVRSFGKPYTVEITGVSEYDLVGKALKPAQRWSH